MERFVRLNPMLYPKVEGDIHRANLQRFLYSLFYVVDGDTIAVLSCFHQHQHQHQHQHPTPAPNTSTGIR